MSANLRTNTALESLDRELKVLKASYDKILPLAEQIETFRDAIGVLGEQIRQTLETEPPLANLSRRDIPGLALRNYDKDIRPWIVESLQWALGMPVQSSFKIFQAGRRLADVIRQDLVRLEREHEGLKARVMRGESWAG